GDSQAIHFELGCPIDDGVNLLFILPAHECIGRQAVPEIVLARTGPDEMRRVIRVDSNEATTVGRRGEKEAVPFATALLSLKRDAVGVRASLGWQKTDTE